MYKQAGFTLIELLVVVLIIGVLAAIAVPQYQKAVLKSRFSSLMPSTRAVRDGNELYYMTQNRYATNVSDLDVKVASNDDGTIQVKNDGDYIYTIATAPKLKNNLVMYQKHSGKFAGEIHCEADKDDAQAIWLCSQGLHGVEKDGSLTPNYKTYILEGTGADSFGSAASGRTITNIFGAYGGTGQCSDTDTICKEFAQVGTVFQYSDGSMLALYGHVEPADGRIHYGALVFNDVTNGKMSYEMISNGDRYVGIVTYDNNKTLEENFGAAAEIAVNNYETGNKEEQSLDAAHPEEIAYYVSHYVDY